MNSAPRLSRQLGAETSDAKSDKEGAGFPPLRAHPKSVFHLVRGPGSGPPGRLAAGGLAAGVNLRFLLANSSRKQHDDDAAIGSASPLPTT